MHTVAMRRTHRVVPVLTAVILLAASCAGSAGDDDGAPLSPDNSIVQSTPGDGPGLVDKPNETDSIPGASDASIDSGTDGTLTPRETAATEPPIVATVLPTVPEIGVPGIDSADLFCRSWSEFAGTFQALALASSFEAGDLSAQRSEVVASGVVIAAVAGLGEHLPAELESERQALTVGLVGPMERRALSAYTGLEAAGLTKRQLDELSELWLSALVAAGVDEPDIQLDVPDDVSLRVEGVVSAFSTSIPLIREDPSLITDVSIPLTDAYIVDNCPDQGTLGGNDVIDQ